MLILKKQITEILNDLNVDELDEVIKITNSRKIVYEVIELFHRA